MTRFSPQYLYYISSSAWRIRRQRAIERAGKRCQMKEYDELRKRADELQRQVLRLGCLPEPEAISKNDENPGF